MRRSRTRGAHRRLTGKREQTSADVDSLPCTDAADPAYSGSSLLRRRIRRRGGGYLDSASDIGDIVSGVLGIVLWPLILLGINLQV